MPDIRMPDGAVVRFPNSMPKEQIRSMIASKFPDAVPGDSKPEAPKEERGFLRRQADNFMGGVDAVADGLTLGAAPYIRGAVRGAMEGTGTGGGINTELQRQAKRREDQPVASFVNEMAGGALTGGGMAAAGKSFTGMLAPRSNMLQRSAAVGGDAAVLGTAQQAVKEADEAVRTGEVGLDDLGDLAGAAGMSFATGAVANAGLEKGASALRRAGRKIAAARNSRSLDEIKQAKSATYQLADEQGASVTPDELRNGIANVQQQFNAIQLDADVGLMPHVNRYIRALNKMADSGQPIPRADVERVLSMMKADLRGSAITGSERNSMGRALDAMDDWLLNAPMSAKPGKDAQLANRAIEGGRSLRRQEARSELIEDIFDARAGYLSGEESGIRNKVGSILKNKKQRAMFNVEELEAMEEVVAGGPIEQMLRVVGRNRFLGALGGYAVAGPVGAVASPFVSAAAKSGADARSRAAAGSLRNLVNARGQIAPAGSREQFLDALARNAGPATAGALTPQRDRFLEAMGQ